MHNTSADGTAIGFDRYGDGPAVIFIGGATEYRTPGQVTTQAAQQLAERGYTTIDYDRRGRGQSGDTPPWSLDREVDDLMALLEGIDAPIALYTSSSGATVALAAIGAGADVTKLALYEPPFFKGIHLTEHLTSLQLLLNAGDNDAAARYNLTNVVGLPSTAVEKMAREPWWADLVNVAPTLLYDLTAVHEINVDPRWARRWSAVEVPAVVYSGQHTFPGLTQAADDVAAALPDAKRVVLAGQGHKPAPEAIVPSLADFLRLGD